MKFSYEYRTSDNVRHSGEIAAADREAAFRLLKAQGIRPGSLYESAGFFNKLFGKGKRWMAIGVLALLALILVGVVLQERRAAQDVSGVFDDKTRRQVIGDSAIIEYGIRTAWAEVFPHDGERFLASFAIPGVAATLRNTTEDEIRAALMRRAGVSAGDGLEVRQIKSMVEGLKDELRLFIKKGGTIVEYGHRLVERQERECAYYRHACDDVENAVKTGATDRVVYSVWKSRNEELRRIGVRLVPIPDGMIEKRRKTSVEASNPLSKESGRLKN